MTTPQLARTYFQWQASREQFEKEQAQRRKLEKQQNNQKRKEDRNIQTYADEGDKCVKSEDARNPMVQFVLT